MEQKFHLFVRRHPGVGYTVSVLTHPFLTAFSDDVDAARADVAQAASKLLARNAWEIGTAATWWKEMRLRRVDMTLRAVQHQRLLSVPIRFTVLTHPEFDAPPGRAKGPRPIIVRIPRLGIVDRLAIPDDLEAWVEEIVRHRLFMVPLETGA